MPPGTGLGCFQSPQDVVLYILWFQPWGKICGPLWWPISLLSFSFYPVNLSLGVVLAAMADQRFPCRWWLLLHESGFIPTLTRSVLLWSFLLLLLFFAFAALDLAWHDGNMEAPTEPHLFICMIG